MNILKTTTYCPKIGMLQKKVAAPVNVAMSGCGLTVKKFRGNKWARKVKKLKYMKL